MIGQVRRRIRTITPTRPAELGVEAGLAYSLWLPDHPAERGIVILHGAGSRKESHHDYARAALANGFAAVAFDQRGHGESEGEMDGRVFEDIGAIVSLLRSRLAGADGPVALRGSSMGGYLAIAAASRVKAGAVVAICPAPAEGLRRSLQAGTARFEHDSEALDGLLAANDLATAVDSLGIPLLLLHAEGDEVVPVQYSRELAKHSAHPQSRLIAVPGGHHRSVQHDAELQMVSLRWLDRALA